MLTDGNGIPLAGAVDGANRHDTKLLAATLDGVAVLRPEPEEVEQHLCLDNGYDYGFVREQVEGRGYEHHIRGSGQAQAQAYPYGKARRWVVEEVTPGQEDLHAAQMAAGIETAEQHQLLHLLSKLDNAQRRAIVDSGHVPSNGADCVEGAAERE